GRAHPRADIIGTSRAFAEIEVRRDGRKSMMGELAGRLFDPFVPAGHVMNEHHARQGRAERARVIGFADIAAVAAKSDGLREHAFVSHAVPHLLDGLRHDYTEPSPGLGVQSSMQLETRRNRGAALSRGSDRARPYKSGPDPKSRWSCLHAA